MVIGIDQNRCSACAGPGGRNGSNSALGGAADAFDTPLTRISEASIAELRAAPNSGRPTSTELTSCYPNRIAHYDLYGLCLNAVRILNPALFDDARAADEGGGAAAYRVVGGGS